MQTTLPNRKYPRLKHFDYNSNGYYFITICTDNFIPFLSKIKADNTHPALPETISSLIQPELTPIGQIVEEQLLALSERFPSVTIDKYVIMPNHIHAIIIIHNDETDPNSKSHEAHYDKQSMLMATVRVIKSLTTRMANQMENRQGRKIWQRSFYDEIVRNNSAYQRIWQYIDENPAKWHEDRYHRS